MKLVIITGPEATGKSFLAQELSKKLGYAVLSKDQIKENLFDTEKVSTWDYRCYESYAKDLLFKKVQGYICSGNSIIIESNFNSKDINKKIFR